MNYGANEDWVINNGGQMDNRPLSPYRPTNEQVDKLADELALEYDNEQYRPWYCKLIHQFGVERILYWRRLAATGRNPGALFGYYARQAATEPSQVGTTQKTSNSDGLDTVYEPNDEDTTPEGIKRLFDQIDEDGYDDHQR